MKLRIGALVASLTILALTGCGASPTPSTSTAASSTSAAAPSASAAAPSGSASASYRMADVATHHTQQDCWAAIDGGVYDLTLWISRHPGGPDKIIGLCGTDATSAFHNQHDGQQRPNEQLATFRIGSLVD